MPGREVIHISNLYKSFGDTKVLRGFNLDLNKEENVVVLGKSGSGKSVLIKCIIGLIKPEKGEIRVFDQDILHLDQKNLDELRMRIGFLFQSNALYDSMTVRENLEFPLRRHSIKLTEKETSKLVEKVLDNVGLPQTAEMQPSELSGGMKKRIALARTLILNPEIILYDEPTTGLDSITAKDIADLIVNLSKEYKTSSIIISHDMNCVKRVADRIVMLIDGIAYKEGKYSELKNSDDNKIRQFFE